jgi:hypothetical protein
MELSWLIYRRSAILTKSDGNGKSTRARAIKQILLRVRLAAHTSED